MKDSELLKLLKDTESDRVERKASLSDKNKIAQAICAFANDIPNYNLPGVVLIGVNDDGSFSEIAITDKLLLDLADLKTNGNIYPFPMMTVQKRVLNDCELAVIIVYPSDYPPVRYKGRTWIRIGPRRGIATPEEERRLIEKRLTKDLPYDIHPLGASSITDLDLDLFTRIILPSFQPPEVIEENTRTIEEQLASLRFTTLDGIPTVLGILVTGINPRMLIPCSYVQFLRIDGEDITDPIISQKEIQGALPDLLRRLEEVLELNISVASDITSSSREIRSPDYPLQALQQLCRNAVLHRSYQGTNAPIRVYWYNDRIEIHSPGGPYGQVNRDNFGKPAITDYRNTNLAEAMKHLGYVQRFGYGLVLAKKVLAINGNPDLEFVVDDTNILVTIRKRV
ncbi:MAG: ATP-binding protein [Candidatus Hatepunaea meridiana]|nr:ATP-binding protein [Candidatus Hatepunaea meridiana]